MNVKKFTTHQKLKVSASENSKGMIYLLQGDQIGRFFTNLATFWAIFLKFGNFF